MADLPESFVADDRTTLVELVNRVVDRGVSLSGDITISVADVDLLYVGLRLLLCSPNDVFPPRTDETTLPPVDLARREKGDA